MRVGVGGSVIASELHSSKWGVFIWEAPASPHHHLKEKTKRTIDPFLRDCGGSTCSFCLSEDLSHLLL